MWMPVVLRTARALCKVDVESMLVPFECESKFAIATGLSLYVPAQQQSPVGTLVAVISDERSRPVLGFVGILCSRHAKA